MQLVWHLEHQKHQEGQCTETWRKAKYVYQAATAVLKLEPAAWGRTRSAATPTRTVYQVASVNTIHPILRSRECVVGILVVYVCVEYVESKLRENNAKGERTDV